MSDGEYDKLFNSLKLIEQDHPELLMEDSPTQRVTETPSDAFEPVEHQRRMYSLDNIENSEDLKKWFERLEKITEKQQHILGFSSFGTLGGHDGSSVSTAEFDPKKESIGILKP